MNKKEILFYLQQHGLAPNKLYGQHFLYNEKYLGAIVSAINLQESDCILEIGPGLGAVTKRLPAHVKKVIAVEIDAGFVRFLENEFSGTENVTIVHDDFLKTPPVKDCTLIFGNLPYNISSQIVFRIAEHYTVPRCCFLVQKEMAQRLLASPGSAMYSAFTVGASLYFDVQKLFDIPPQAFYPAPKVYSTFIQLLRKSEIPLNETQKSAFEKLVATVFWARRKTLKSALKRSPYGRYDEAVIAQTLYSLGLHEKVRGEELPLNTFIALAKCFAYNGNEQME